MNPAGLVRRSTNSRIQGALQPRARPQTIGYQQLMRSSGLVGLGQQPRPSTIGYEQLMRSAGMPIGTFSPAANPEQPGPRPDPPSADPGTLDPGGADYDQYTNTGNVNGLPVDLPSDSTGGNDYGGSNIFGSGPTVEINPSNWRDNASAPYVPRAGRPEPWYGRVARHLIPYGAGHLTHAALEAYRRYQDRRHARGAGGPRPERQQQATRPFDPSQASGTRWDMTRGAYVPTDNARGAQFNPQAANAMTMWSMGLHGNPNARGVGREPGQERFYGQNMHRNEHGGFELQNMTSGQVDRPMQDRTPWTAEQRAAWDAYRRERGW